MDNLLFQLRIVKRYVPLHLWLSNHQGLCRAQVSAFHRTAYFGTYFKNLLASLLCFPCPSSSFICDHGIPSSFLSSEDRPHIGHCTAGKAAFLPTKLLIRSSTLTVVLLLGLWAGSQLAYQAPPGGGLTRKQQHGNIRNKDKLDGALVQLVENWKGRWQNNLKMKNCVWSGLTCLSWLSTEV